MTEIVRLNSAPVPRAEVVAVPFLDGHIPCVLVDDEPMVIPKPISDLMGLNWAGQYTKISADQTACIEFVSIQMPGDDQARRNMVIGLETFTLWLGGLQPSRVKHEARDTVIAYKREAGRALREHFFGKKRELTRKELARFWYEAEARAEQLTEENSELQAENAAMLPAVEAWEQVVDARGLIPMAVFAQQSQVIRPNGQLLGQNTAIVALREIRVLKDAPGTEEHNTPYQQHSHRIKTKAERRGSVTVNVPYVFPKHAQYLTRRIAEHFHPGRNQLPRVRYGQIRAIEGGAER